MPSRSNSGRAALERSSSLPAAAAVAAGRQLHRAVTATLVCLLCYTLLEASLCIWWSLQLSTVGPCQRDNEGSWSIGIFKGPSPLDLLPLERYEPRQDTHVAWPVANPVLTCASVGDSPSNFVADPFLLRRGDKLYMFYETKSTEQQKGQIGVAVSSDGGMSFQHQAVVLDLPWHLSYPFVFEHNGQVYMLPEASQSGRLTLYRATDFPLAWQEDRLLLPRPLIDASLVEWQGRWYLLGSDHTRRGAFKNGHLEVWHAASPLGPWEPHPANPVANGDRSQGFRSGGRLVVHDGRLLRFGQDCGQTYGHKLVAFEVTKLTPTEFEQRRIDHNIGGLAGHRKVSWNSERHHHIDVQQLPSGEWIAAIDGDRVPSGQISQRLLRTVARVVMPWVLVAALWMAASISMTHSPAFRRWAIASGIVLAPPPAREARGGGGSARGLLLNNAVLRRMQLGQLSKKKMRSVVEFDRDVEASLPLADGHVRVLPDSASGGPASKQHPAAGAAAAGAAAAAEKGLAGTAHAAEGATQQQQQQQQQQKADGAAPQAVHAGLKSPPGASLQYRVTRSMAARASGATSPTSPLPGMARTSSRTGGIRQPGGARRRCLPLRMHLCTVVTAHLAVAALLGAVGAYLYVAPFHEVSKPYTVDGQFSQASAQQHGASS
ncbi:hypothetical protein ABPG77_009266 [Micractinium sp. CCAP 211/92]